MPSSGIAFGEVIVVIGQCESASQSEVATEARAGKDIVSALFAKGVTKSFKVICCSANYYDWSLNKTLESAARVGYDGVELMADRPHGYPPDLDAESRKKLASKLKSLNLELAQVSAVHVLAANDYYRIPPAEVLLFYENGGEPCFGHPNERVRRIRVDYTKESIDLAADLGCKLVVTTSGRLTSPPELAWKYWIQGLTECVEHAEEKKVKLALHISTGVNLCPTMEGPRSWMATIEEIHSPMLGLCWDTALPVGNYPLEEMQKYRDVLFTVHVKDSIGGYTIELGKGDLDVKGVVNNLRDIGYEGPLCLELYTYWRDPEPANRRSVDCMRNILARGR